MWFAGLVPAVFAAVGGCTRAPAPVTQPMAMSHKRHLEAGAKCVTCHPGAEDEARAGFPTVADCMDCHSRARGSHPDEPLIRVYAERRQEIPWARVNRMPEHVYFSHSLHVGPAKLRCEECHRGILEAVHPLALPDVHLQMKDCMRCHAERKASNQCKACHK